MTYRPLAVGNGTTFDTVGDPRIGAAAGDIPQASVADLTTDLAAKLGTLTVNAQTGTTYTLTTTDPQKVVTMTNAAASAVTVPTNAAQAVTIGSQIEIVNLSTGVACTVAPAGGVTLHGGSVVLSPGSSVTVAKIGTDVWMVQGQGAPGLTLVASQTFSAASSVSVNNCFAATYDAYRVIIKATGSTGNGFSTRLRVGGVDAATNYQRFGVYGGAAGPTNVNTTGATEWAFGAVTTTSASLVVLDLSAPAIAASTQVDASILDSGGYGIFVIGVHTTATAYDGLSFYANSGTITGTIRVYGYRNA